MKSSCDSAADYLMSRIDWERAKSIPYAERTFRLDRMRQLLALLGDPQESLKIVHVAGTKGKGSTTAMLASIFHAAGLKAGAFTSPHLERIEERFAIDGRPCSGETFAELIELIRPVVEVIDREMPGDGPTYFEIATAVALLCFVRAKVDVAVLEVGLGGRLDSTNVCQPEVSVITSISLDHTEQLGSTLAEIATEKAGIIKSGVPIISGVLAPEAQAVLRRTCREHGSTLLELGTDFHAACVSRGSEPDWQAHFFDYHEADHDYSKLKLGMLGAHQTQNAAVAIATIHQLRRQGWTISESALRQGLATARCPARVELFDETLQGKPLVVIDAAHNGASIESLIETLARSIPAKRRHLLFATTVEKDLSAMIGPLIRAFDRIIFTRYTINPRSVDPTELLQLAEKERKGGLAPFAACGPKGASHKRGLAPFAACGPKGASHKRCLSPSSVPTHHSKHDASRSDEQARRLSESTFEVDDDPIRAFERLRVEAGPDELICVTGSFFIAAEVRRLLVP